MPSIKRAKALSPDDHARGLTPHIRLVKTYGTSPDTRVTGKYAPMSCPTCGKHYPTNKLRTHLSNAHDLSYATALRLVLQCREAAGMEVFKNQWDRLESRSAEEAQSMASQLTKIVHPVPAPSTASAPVATTTSTQPVPTGTAGPNQGAAQNG